MSQALLIGLLVGVISGIWPLVVGFRVKRRELGVLGFLLCVAAGSQMGFLLAAPVAVGCGWLLERIAKPAEAAETKSTDGGNRQDP